MTGSSIKRQFKILIPRKPTSSLTGISHAASTRRTPQYVSFGTLGLGIVTLQGGKQVDSESFSTNPSDNPNCKAQLGAATICTFTIGVLGGNDSMSISAYDVEPIAPMGGNATAFPSGANLLSTNSASLTGFVAGQNTPIALALGGVPISSELVSDAYPHMTNIIGAATPVSTIAGQSPTTNVIFAVQSLDAAGDIIVGDDTLFSPITITAEEFGGTGYEDIVVLSTDPSGNVTAGNPGQSVTSSHPNDQLAVIYNGEAPAGYSVALSLAPGNTADPNGVGHVNPSNAAGILAALTITPGANLLTDAPNAYFGIDHNNIPTITETNESGPDENPTFTLTSAIASTEPQQTNAPIPGSPIGSCPSARVPSHHTSNLYSIQFNNEGVTGSGGSQTCFFNMNDGTVGGVQQLKTVFTAPTGISFFPSSFVGVNCGSGGGVRCTSAYEDYSTAALYTTATGTPTYSVVSCTADGNSGCSSSNVYSGTNTIAYCDNESGFIAVRIVEGSELVTNARGYGGYAGNSSGNAQHTGNFACTVGITDGLGNTAQYPIKYFVGARPQSMGRVRVHLK